LTVGFRGWVAWVDLHAKVGRRNVAEKGSPGGGVTGLACFYSRGDIALPVTPPSSAAVQEGSRGASGQRSVALCEGATAPSPSGVLTTTMLPVTRLGTWGGTSRAPGEPEPLGGTSRAPPRWAPGDLGRRKDTAPGEPLPVTRLVLKNTVCPRWPLGL